MLFSKQNFIFTKKNKLKSKNYLLAFTIICISLLFYIIYKYNSLLSNFNECCNSTYNLAINLYYEGKFNEAHYIFDSITQSSPKYEMAQNYIDSINSKQESNNEEDKKVSSSIVNSINPLTINNLSLDSDSNYLLHVDLTTQKTYVYSGYINNWKLIKTLICSTGIEDKKTPEGSYKIQQRGDWFFSEKYNQGGKYWLQFDGNYLFHSVPYDKDKKNILDYTLGTPASHGCIRLSEADSKWLYDNIPAGSKVLINKG